MGTDSCKRRTTRRLYASIVVTLACAYWARDIRAAISVDVAESSPDAFIIAVSTDVVFDTLIVGVDGNVADGVNLVPVHELLAGRQIVSTSNGFRLLSPLGSPDTDGVIEPGISHDIDLTYGVTIPVPGEWVDGLDSVPFLGFRLLGGTGNAHAQFIYRGATVEEATVAIHLDAVSGDYNHNGSVDAADYALWRNTLGQVGGGLAADGNENQQIDAGDYIIWKAHFGQQVGSSSLVYTNAPEPTTLAIFAGVILSFTLRRGHQRCRPSAERT